MLKSKAIIEEIKEGGNIIDLSGDGRCDSPGHNAKYLTYSFINKSTNKLEIRIGWKRWDSRKHWRR